MNALAQETWRRPGLASANAMHEIVVSGGSQPRQIDLTSAGNERILLLSMRKVADLVGYCAMYEFEDAVAGLVGAELAQPASLAGLEFSRRAYKLVRYATGSPQLADAIRPRLGELRVQRSYDLFLPVFNHAHELFALNAIPHWRERCRVAVCYLSEAWIHELPVYLIELLRKFDHIFLGVRGAIEAVARISGRPCSYLPMGVDALRFCPHPTHPPRTIDICGIGRRSPVTHQALLELAQKTGIFYYYDTVHSRPLARLGKQVTFRVTSPSEHRLLLANILKRSRYFIANRAWADRPELVRGRDEIAARFYEGAAAGAIMLGEPPDSDDFRSQFDWPDTVIRIPFDAPRVAEVIAELDADPERAARISRDNVVNALRRHDWVYRLRTLLDAGGVAPTEPMLARERRLKTLADDLARRSS